MDWSRHFKIRHCAALVTAGGVIAYPTEAVWGLGCDPWDREAVERLLALKQRPMAKGLILVAADLDQLEPLLRDLTPAQRRELANAWPGPVTYLVPNNGLVPYWVTGEHDSVALRVSAHSIVKGLCRAAGGPLVSTSANPAGKPPARDRLTVIRYFGQSLDFVTPGRTQALAKPSEIRDLQSGQIIRPG